MSDKKRERLTGRGDPAPEDAAAPTEERLPDGQHADHWVLPEEERAKGFVRPVRRTYRHEACGMTTTMGRALAETIARDPSYYGATFCAHCGDYFRIGEKGEFTWLDDGTKMGT